MTVDESYSPGQEQTNKKFYHVRAIEIETVSSVGIGKNHTPIMEDTASRYSIADLFAFVKQYDGKFSPKPVSRAVLNEDGTSKVWWHQTGELFNFFNNDRPVAALYDSETPNGYFVKENNHDIGLGGKYQMPLYVSAKNVLHFKDRQQANLWYRKHVPGYKELAEAWDRKNAEFEAGLCIT